jgi:hypothetical protein
MFELPIKGDIDRTLSNLMHDARHRLMIEKNRIMAEAAQAGALQGNRVIVTVASAVFFPTWRIVMLASPLWGRAYRERTEAVSAPSIPDVTAAALTAPWGGTMVF